MRPGVWDRLANARLYLDQTDTSLEVDRAQVETFYHPLAVELLSRYSSTPRLMVAVAGPPGSGKTAFATILVAVINAEAEENTGVFVGLDGWHYSNQYLDTHFIDRGGERIPLRRIKGAPETFDAAAAYEALLEIGQGGQVTFPVYSRRLHEPVPGAGVVDASHKIVVAEGNYLLLDEDPWRRFRTTFDICLFISAPLEILLASLRERHQRGGKTSDTTARHMQEVDLPNIKRVAPCGIFAQVHVYKSGARQIERIEWTTKV